MYSWIWKHLPGNKWVKALQCFVLILGIAALLWFVIFPWAEPFLPFDDGTVDSGDTGGDNNGGDDSNNGNTVG